jgi:site-specific DNA-methyltransferase (adenine-specific)
MGVQFLLGDALEVLRDLPEGSVDCVVTSPPYWGLRSYLLDSDPLKSREIGGECSAEEYVEKMVAVFCAVRRVLRDAGTLWLNLGDSYVAKDLAGIPWRVALALQVDGWHLRQDIIWHKPACMPESTKDRCTRAHEYVFMFTKNQRYFYDAQAVAEPARTKDRAAWTDRGSEKQRGHSRRHAGFNGRYAAKILEQGAPKTRNRRSVWTIPSVPYKEAHFAVMPPRLVEVCLSAGCPLGGTVLDPFGGSGTVGMVATKLGRSAILIDLDARNAVLVEKRLAGLQLEIS